jgi:hypothetical protein
VGGLGICTEASDSKAVCKTTPAATKNTNTPATSAINTQNDSMDNLVKKHSTSSNLCFLYFQNALLFHVVTHFLVQ